MTSCAPGSTMARSPPGQLAVVTAAQAARILGVGAARPGGRRRRRPARRGLGGRQANADLAAPAARPARPQGAASGVALGDRGPRRLGARPDRLLGDLGGVRAGDRAGDRLAQSLAEHHAATARPERERDRSIAGQADAMRLLLEAQRRLQEERAGPVAALAALRRAMTRDEQLWPSTGSWPNRPAGEPPSSLATISRST